MVAFHARLSGVPYAANRAVAVLSRMYRMAASWGMNPDGTNPCRGVRKFPTRPRERFLTDTEFRRLGTVLDRAEADGGVSGHAVAAIRLLLLTGCRKSEILSLRWEDVDVAAGEIRLADSKTGPRAVPLSPPAVRRVEDVHGPVRPVARADLAYGFVERAGLQRHVSEGGAVGVEARHGGAFVTASARRPSG